MKKIGFWEAYSIGVGGMIGGGIFAVLGLTILLSKGAAPVAFIFAGTIALLTAYSYAKLSVRFPSEGGTVEFLVRAFGNNFFTSYMNTLLLASYVIMLSLYSYAFGSYASALLVGHEILWLKKLFIVFVIVFFSFLNFLGAYVSGKAEDLMVFVKLGILFVFSFLGLLTGDFSRLSPSEWESTVKIMVGGLVIFLAYEGFELIANTARDVDDPERVLPKAFYASVSTVILVYVFVAIVAVANLSYEKVVKYRDYALAVAAKPFLGEAGFVLIGIAALLSTASAINATLYGSARVSYLVAKFGALPKNVSKKVWKEGTEGLLILSALTILFAVSFNLEGISVAGSFGFLTVFAAVNFANFKLYDKTDSNRWLSFLAFLMCVVSGIVLLAYNLKVSPVSLLSVVVVFASTFLFELVYRNISSVKLKEYIDWRLKEGEDFVANYELYVPLIVKHLKRLLKGADVYLVGKLAKGEKDKTHYVKLAVVMPSDESPDGSVEKVKKLAGIKEFHPVKIEFFSVNDSLPDDRRKVE